LWFTVWAVLVVGWIVGVLFGLRWLWRKAVALGRELGELERLVERLNAAIAAAPPSTPLAPVAVGTDGSEAAGRVAAARRARHDRREARRRRTAERYAQWSVLAGRRD
jgi:hypothetical protein